MTSESITPQTQTVIAKNRRRVWLRVLLAFVFVAFIGTATVCVGISQKIRRANSTVSIDGFPSAEPLAEFHKTLIISPHPDDESLACAGLIQRIKSNGGEVKIAFITNGDAFKVAAGRDMKKVKINGKSLIDFGRERQEEAIRAAGQLGLSEKDIVFMGFPDRGIASMWAVNWEVPYRSPQTQTDRNPYAKAYSPASPYSGKELLTQLNRLITCWKPNLILAPHPLDDHPDHYAAYAFTTAAMDIATQKNPDYARSISLMTYLVHRGVWPAKTGTRDDTELAPPAALLSTDTRWMALELTDTEVENKLKAISLHKSQTAVAGKFLKSFARQNELFGLVASPRIAAVEPGTIRIDGNGDDWAGIKPQIRDPVGDNLGRVLEEGADIKSLWVASDPDYLYIRIDTARSMPRGLNLKLIIRQADSAASSEVVLTFSPKSKTVVKGIRWAWRSKTLEAAIPAGQFFDSDRIWVGVSSKYLGFNIDKTGWRPMQMARY